MNWSLCSVDIDDIPLDSAALDKEELISKTEQDCQDCRYIQISSVPHSTIAQHSTAVLHGFRANIALSRRLRAAYVGHLERSILCPRKLVGRTVRNNCLIS